MEIVLFVIFMIVVIIRQISSKNTEEGKGKSPSQSSPSYRSSASQTSRSTQSSNRYASSANAGSFSRQTASRTGRPTSSVNQRDGRVYASIDFDNTHYHAEGFDFDCCISFKGLPPGTDELAVLIASNNSHERELSKLLQERQA